MMGPKFSKPILADPDVYYMSCPEAVAGHLARSLEGCRTGLELCCGVGITVIQLALVLDHVYGIDSDPSRIEMASRNAELYGVTEKTSFIWGDALDASLGPSRVDVVVIDPDWSAGEDKAAHVQSIHDTIPDLERLFQRAKLVTETIVLRIPLTLDRTELDQLGSYRLETICWGGRERFCYAYFPGEGYSSVDFTSSSTAHGLPQTDPQCR